eukprot:gnl/TRDRNA2_/TRDRNA2_186504_c0_seq1.p1 gnl/TRDRNA2_/TRDRNA2_186504_c0~~gnl/TRDRNA2_/TRDRNA2_186504_c0_seq1.p1  ORF type:complete len:393 (+),score=47.38 gnl/TRDRNA2_/TRDRNA2_186504_c0_seq1:74-1180(+)
MAPDDASWRSGLDAMSAALVAGEVVGGFSGDWVPALIRRKTFDGGSSWLQLAVEDLKAPSGLRRISLPLSSQNIRPIGDSERRDSLQRLSELATRAGLVANVRELSLTAVNDVELEVVTLGCDHYRVVAPADASVSEIRGLVSKASGVPESEMDLMLGTSCCLTDAAARPLRELNAGAECSETAPTVQITLVRRRPIACLTLDVATIDTWAASVEEAGICTIEIRGTVGGMPGMACLRRLFDILASNKDTVVGLALGVPLVTGGHLDHADTEALAAVLPPGLRTLDIAGRIEGPASMRLVANALPKSLERLDVSYCHGRQVAEILAEVAQRLPSLRSMKVRGGAGNAFDVDERNLIRVAASARCEVEF